MKPDKIIIGWREWLDLPDLGITKIKAKIDTGARSSALHAFHLHPVIRTNVLLGGRQWAIELTLTNRDVMGFRMLLGREALKKGFLVHPNKSFLLS